MKRPSTPKQWRAYNKRLAADENYPVWKVYLCEQCGAPLMGGAHRCKGSEAREVGHHQSLVQRLREPLNISSTSDKVGTIIRAGAKLDAVGEALAYLIEKKHMKKHIKKRGG